MDVCGIDEAGRGSMVGPLVVAGVAADRPGLRMLRSMGVRDSKRLSPASRERLYGMIRSVARVSVSKVPPRSIDASVRRHGLNDLEARYMARVAAALGSRTTYVDACDVDAARFGRRVSELSGLRIRSHHRADSRFAIVSAASIIAKVERDRAVARLGLGSGYPSDPVCRRRLARLYAEAGSMPSFARKSWRPVAAMMSGGS
ncbi:MAG: ribonuclease HII [Nitrosopumilus sp.]|nr:ribonuclease HII [Nitrosopumilus sp.]